MKSPVLLIIVDGFGIAKPSDTNAVSKARMPFYKKLLAHYPSTHLSASGDAVGLPLGRAGNSEAGHMNIGAGRVVVSDSVKISREISSGAFFGNSTLKQACLHVKKNKSSMHIMGLLSAGQSAHAEYEHLLALLEFSRMQKVNKVYLHLFTDGRDSNPFLATELVKKLRSFLQSNEFIATLCGRLYAMDRKKDWRKTQMAYDMLTLSHGVASHEATHALEDAYLRGENDEYLLPTVIVDKNRQPLARIDDHDAVIFFNLRSDRARQLTKPFVQKDFEKLGGFVRKKILSDLFFVTLTDFGPFLDQVQVAYPAEKVQESLPYVLGNLSQLYVAESEKFAHITYFLNGGFTNAIGHEERIVVPSPDVSNYRKTPQMSLVKITQTVIKAIKTRKYDFIGINIANPDMIGHTTDIKSTIRACEAVDRSLKILVTQVLRDKGKVFITSDHGKAEALEVGDSEVMTRHTTNDVPFIVVDPQYRGVKMPHGKLANVSPTILHVLGIKTPKSMTAKSLLK